MPASKASKKAKTEGGDVKESTTRQKAKSKAPSKVPAQRKRLVGRLADLMTVPVDVFIEICIHLFPIDLLHLSWASKRFRSILMSKTARPIWRSARENQLPTLPPCPDDLSEPQYTALIFTTICQACGVNRAHRVHFGLRTRHCAACYPNYVGTLNAIFVRYPSLGSSIVRLANLLPQEIYTYYNLAEVDALVEEYSSLDDDDTRAKLVASWAETSREIDKSAYKVQQWLEEQTQIKNKQNHDLGKTRWESIQKKLQELGWDKRDFPPEFSDNEWSKLTRKSQALTDKVWKNLYPKLEPILELQKERRLDRERVIRWDNRSKRIEKLYCAYKDKKKEDNLFFPEFRHIFTLRSLDELRNDDNGEVTEQRWEACLPGLEDALQRETKRAVEDVKTWYSDCIKSGAEYRAMEDNKQKGTNAVPADMSLVTSAFKCGECQEALWLATFHQHEHFVARYAWSAEPAEVDTETSVPGLVGPAGLEFDADTQTMLSKLLVTSGYDPQTATVEDVVLRHGELYACDRCADIHQKPIGFGKMVSHYVAEASWYKYFIGKSECPNGHSVEPEMGTAFRILEPLAATTMRDKYMSDVKLYGAKQKRAGYESNEYWTGARDRWKTCRQCHFKVNGNNAVCQMVHHLEAKHSTYIDMAKLDQVPDDYNYPFGFGTLVNPFMLAEYDEGYNNQYMAAQQSQDHSDDDNW